MSNSETVAREIRASDEHFTEEGALEETIEGLAILSPEDFSWHAALLLNIAPSVGMDHDIAAGLIEEARKKCERRSRLNSTSTEAEARAYLDGHHPFYGEPIPSGGA